MLDMLSISMNTPDGHHQAGFSQASTSGRASQPCRTASRTEVSLQAAVPQQFVAWEPGPSLSDLQCLQAFPSLAARCASVCVQHCAKLQGAAGSETTVLDIGCGTGGCCFELAAR